jgi:hypothetical protein
MIQMVFQTFYKVSIKRGEADYHNEGIEYDNNRGKD